jgi:hypothetical protein
VKTMNPAHFEVLILIGRPASGKSEIIDLLLRTPAPERASRFRLGEVDRLDDFPMLWAWFEEDYILSEKLGQPRLHTDAQGYFKYGYLWHLLIERLGLEYHKRLGEDPAYHERTTTLLEFSRGSQHGGYRAAFPHLPDDLLGRAGVLYVNVSFEESLRKNRRRYNPERPHSILEHGLPDEKLERLYRHDDWAEFSAPDLEYLHVKHLQVPYVVFENEDDVTSGPPEQLAARLESVLGRLWLIRNAGKF